MLKSIIRRCLKVIKTDSDTSDTNSVQLQTEVRSSESSESEPTPKSSNGSDLDFVAQLMAGSAQWEPFDHKQMIDLTDDSALCSYYEKSQCNNVSEFLALSEKRFDIRGYWKPCEEMLQFILRSHFPTEAPPLKQAQSEEGNSDSLSIHSQLQTPPLTTIAQTTPSHDEIEDFVDELMAGRITWQPLEQIEMTDLSSNNGLLYYYELSQCTNLGEFITLADKRFKIRGYWEGSEKRLKEELTKFFESQALQDIHQDTPSQSEEDYTAGYGQNLEDPTLPCQNTTEQLNAPPPKTTEKLSESPLTLREGENLIQQEQRHRDLTTHLMYGSTQWDGFDGMSISDITQHSALCKFYNRVNAGNLSEFLALGRTRMSHQGYGKSTEQKLRESLLHFFKKNSAPPTPITSRTEQENPSANATQPAESIEQSETAKDLRTNSELPATEIDDFVDNLLAANATWEPFNQKEMQDLTTNLVLCYIYKNSACANLSEFLALSNKRLHLRKYRKEDEKLLKKELINFFQLTILTLAAVEKSTKATQNSSEHTEAIAPCPVITPDSESAALTDIVEEPPEACAPLIEAEKLAAPTVESKPQYTSTASLKELTQELLSGDSHVETFNHLCIEDISNDVRLGNVYNDSQATNVSEFLALGKERMKIKNYGRRSERKLKEGIETYLSHHGNETPLFTQSLREHIGIDHDSLVVALRKGGNPDRVVSAKVWKEICRDLRKSTLANQKIAPIAAELQLKWPISQKSSLSDKSIIDYLDCNITDLSKLDRFGHKKVKVYVTCVTYLHKLHTEGGTSEPTSLEETISILWENSRLSDREQKVLHLRFGIQEERKHTLAEIKEHFGITRERVRQIEKKALEKLRMSRRFEDLPDLIIKNKSPIWEQLTKEPKLKKREWMEPLEDQLGFEYQIAIELIDYRKHRNTSTSALSSWLDQNFPHDESNWYKTQADKGTTDERSEGINQSLEAFLDTL